MEFELNLFKPIVSHFQTTMTLNLCHTLPPLPSPSPGCLDVKFSSLHCPASVFLIPLFPWCPSTEKKNKKKHAACLPFLYLLLPLLHLCLLLLFSKQRCPSFIPAAFAPLRLVFTKFWFKQRNTDLI